MDRVLPDMPENPLASSLQFLIDKCIHGLTDFGVLGDAKQTLWQGGPTRAEVADIILEAISNKEDGQLALLGYQALLSLVIPLEPSVQRQTVEEIQQHVRTSSKVMQRMAEKIKNLFRTSQIIISFISFLFTIISAMYTSKFFDIFFLDKHLNIFWLGIGLAGAAIGFFVMGKNIEIIQNFFKAVIDRKRAYRMNLILESFEMHVYKAIGKLCGGVTGVLSTTLRTQNANTWGKIALQHTNEALPSVVHEVLRLLRVPDVDESIREEIVQWLCRVKVLPQEGSLATAT